jgi:hypothetical protein
LSAAGPICATAHAAGGWVGLPDGHQLIQPAPLQVVPTGRSRPSMKKRPPCLVPSSRTCRPRRRYSRQHLDQLGHDRPSLRVGAAGSSVSTVPGGCGTARQPSPRLSEPRSCPHQEPAPSWMPGRAVGSARGPGGMVDAVACRASTRASGSANEAGRTDQLPALAGSGAELGWLVGRLRLGSARPAPPGQLPPPWARWRTRLPPQGLLAARLRLSRLSSTSTL